MTDTPLRPDRGAHAAPPPAPRARRRPLRRGLLPRRHRRHARPLHRLRGGGGAGLAEGQRGGVGHRRVRHAPPRHAAAHLSASAASSAAAPRRSSASSAAACAPASTSSALGERTIRIDCDVLQADGGTRTASITGGAVALHDACAWVTERAALPASPFRQLVAAVSVGVVDGVTLARPRLLRGLPRRRRPATSSPSSPASSSRSRAPPSARPSRRQRLIEHGRPRRPRPSAALARAQREALR